MSKYAIVQFGNSRKTYSYVNDLEVGVGWASGDKKVVGLSDSIDFDPKLLKPLSSLLVVDKTTGQVLVEPSSLVDYSQAIKPIDVDIQVVDQSSMDRAGDILSHINARIKVIKQHHKPIIEAAYKSHKTAIAQEKSLLEPLEQAVWAIKTSITSYVYNEKVKARAKELELQERQRQEQLKAQTQLQEINEQLQTATFEQSKELYKMQADAMNVLVADTVTVDIPRSDKVSIVNNYDIQVVDNKLVPTHIEQLEIRPIDLGAIKRYVKLMGGNVSIPGIAIHKTHTVRSKS